MSRLMAFLSNDPERVRCLLHPGRDAFVAAAEQADGWGVGFYQGGEVLLQRHPRVLGREVDFYALASTQRTDALVGHVRHATVGPVTTENTHPFRFRSWVFAHHGTIPDFERIQAEMVYSVPDYLRRNIRGQSDSEHLFHLFLSFLHDAARLDDELIDTGTAAEALASSAEFVQRLTQGSQPQLNVVATNGRIMLVGRRGPPIYYYRVNGVRGCAVCCVRDDAGNEIRAVDHEELRGVVAVADVTRAGDQWEELGDGQILCVKHDLTVEIRPFRR